MARLFVLLLACVFASGCFAFDEIDKGNKILDQNFSKPAEKPPAAANAPAAQAGGGGWWATAKSLEGRPTGEGDDAVVSCRVGKATKFMRKADCLSQGGSPKS
jgi:Sclerostin (SOST)